MSFGKKIYFSLVLFYNESTKKGDQKMLIERKKEKEILNNAFAKEGNQFIAIYGRRRIGKTFLVKEMFKEHFAFQHSGVPPKEDKKLDYKEQLDVQLKAFANSMSFYFPDVYDVPKDWFGAFRMLYSCIAKLGHKRKVIFLDELAWMDTPKCDFLDAFAQFYNQWLSLRNDIVLIVCASATSWILNNVIHSSGGLYNRVTCTINLKPFTLKECREYAIYRKLNLNKDQILKYYMVFGGVAYYWDLIMPNLGFEQNIDELFFKANAPLKGEFNYLYRSMFKNYQGYIQIVEALSKKKMGLTRDEIATKTKLSKNGYFSMRLDDLESCGFIRQYHPFGKKENSSIYQLTDNFTLFYYEFLKEPPTDENYFVNLMDSPKKRNWEGRAFEQVCLENVNAIKMALGISGVSTDISSFRCQADEEKGIKGHQIDLVIARRDQIIHLCEMKYSLTPYVIDKKTYEDYLYRIPDFITVTNTKYSVLPLIVTPKGLAVNSYSNYFVNVIDEDDLFL